MPSIKRIIWMDVKGQCLDLNAPFLYRFLLETHIHIISARRIHKAAIPSIPHTPLTICRLSNWSHLSLCLFETSYDIIIPAYSPESTYNGDLQTLTPPQHREGGWQLSPPATKMFLSQVDGYIDRSGMQTATQDVYGCVCKLYTTGSRLK